MFKNIEKGSEEWEFQRLYWEFRKKYYIAEPDNEKYYEQMIEDADVLVKAFANTTIARYTSDIVIACIHDIERRGKLAKKM